MIGLVAAAPGIATAQSRQPAKAAAASMQIFEGENLLRSARTSGGRVATQAMSGFGSGWSGASQLLWSGGSTGAVLDIDLQLEAPAVYAVEIYFTRAPDYAQLALELDGQRSSAVIDAYAPKVTPPTPFQAGRFALQAGTRTLSLKINGKHAQSGGFLVGLDQIRLYPTAALPPEDTRVPEATNGRSVPPATGTTRSPITAARGSTPIATQQPVAAQRRGTAQSSAGTPGNDCASSCLGSVSTVYRPTDDGQCRVWFRIPCDPYGCDQGSGVCRGSCANDGDCGQGSSCATTTGMCSAAPVQCKDPWTVQRGNGQVESCQPYKCVGGTCRETCDEPNDCGPGHTCNTYGRCVSAKVLSKSKQ